MAKKSKKNEDETKKVVANCNNPDEVVANIEPPQETSLSQYDIEKLIVTVRGEQVLIDQDIAKIYGVTTKRLNQQAKRNIARFPSSFRFELTKEEVGEVVANCDHPDEVIANCENPQETSLSQYDIEKLIVTVRDEHSPFSCCLYGSSHEC